ncbi:NADPH-dependent FMN reductase [Jatrophihabitans sp. DSM 45814]
MSADGDPAGPTTPTATVRILLVCGSLRAGSTNEAVLRTAAELTESPGNGDEAVAAVAMALYPGLADLPHFNPDDDRDPLPGSVTELRRALGSCEAVLFCTPEYAGALPGSFKNLLDWTIGGGEMYGKPVGWINASAGGGAQNAHASLRIVLGYAGTTIVEDACTAIPVGRPDVGEDGLVHSPAIRERIADTVRALAAAARA